MLLAFLILNIHKMEMHDKKINIDLYLLKTV